MGRNVNFGRRPSRNTTEIVEQETADSPSPLPSGFLIRFPPDGSVGRTTCFSWEGRYNCGDVRGGSGGQPVSPGRGGTTVGMLGEGRVDNLFLLGGAGRYNCGDVGGGSGGQPVSPGRGGTTVGMLGEGREDNLFLLEGRYNCGDVGGSNLRAHISVAEPYPTGNTISNRQDTVQKASEE
ncbi:hypothetical protein Bbelb_224980 [Branchiostoma belcheri]|nr:hypothetical protein Bbelb_224980 [Branchiostoma belcheri]